MEKRKPGKALDVGMGEGRNALYLAKLGWDVTGFDPADKVVALAAQRAKTMGLALKTGPAAGLAALVHAAQEHGSDVRDWTYVAADGQQRTVSVAITPRTDDQGTHAGWNFVGTDMTEARATERMKDQFVSLISHELRTPLTSILGYLELVLEDEEQPLTDEQRSYLNTVERNADRLLRLVGDLLFTAQVDAGRFTLKPEDVDLASVVRAAEEIGAGHRRRRRRRDRRRRARGRRRRPR